MDDDADTADRLRAAYERYAEHEPSALAAIGLRDLLGRALDLLDEEHAALRQQVDLTADRLYAVARAAREEEQRRCLAWVEHIGTRRVARDGGPRAEVAIERGIDSGEWPPEEG